MGKTFLFTMPKERHPKRKGRRGVKLQVRHTHATAVGLEDAIAIILSMLQELQVFLMFIQARTEKLYSVLREIRSGPYAYKGGNGDEKRVKIIKRV